MSYSTSPTFFVMGLNLAGILITSFLAVVATWLTSRFLDYMNGRASGHWREVINKIESEPMPCAVYYGVRWFALCLLYGLLFSRFV